MYLQGEGKGGETSLHFWVRTFLASGDAAVFSEAEAATEVIPNCVLSYAPEASGLNKLAQILKTLRNKKQMEKKGDGEKKSLEKFFNS